MRCSRCGTENVSNAPLCGQCGTLLAKPCSSCGCKNPPYAKFCSECGAALTPVPQRAAASAETAPIRLPELKVVTALFADLKASKEIGEDLDIERTRAA